MSLPSAHRSLPPIGGSASRLPTRLCGLGGGFTRMSEWCGGSQPSASLRNSLRKLHCSNFVVGGFDQRTDSHNNRSPDTSAWNLSIDVAEVRRTRFRSWSTCMRRLLSVDEYLAPRRGPRLCANLIGAQASTKDARAVTGHTWRDCRDAPIRLERILTYTSHCPGCRYFAGATRQLVRFRDHEDQCDLKGIPRPHLVTPRPQRGSIGRAIVF